MKYINAAGLLPDHLLREVQTYIQAGYLYIPAKADTRRAWGELSGCREELSRRNETIRTERRRGRSIEELAQRYHLSASAIRKILAK